MRYGKERHVIKIENKELVEDLDKISKTLDGYDIILDKIARQMRQKSETLWDVIKAAYPELEDQKSDMTYVRDGTIIFYK